MTPLEATPRAGSWAKSPTQELTGKARPVLALLGVLETRYRDLTDHGRKVGAYARALARRFGLDEDRLELAGRLHDVGKVAVPEAVLLKPAPLTPEEWRLVKRHPEVGAQLLFEAELDDIANWVLAHHERPDGGGYPFGLSGEEIPVEGRILAVADAYEAMTRGRVYREALGREAAREELRAGAGSQFDRQVVEAFLAALDREHDEELEPPAATVTK
jgi:HD-GYP domain-containing protein (c-di-GMP phosphodiesterase class II)